VVNRPIAQIAASIILVLAVISVMFGTALGGSEPSPEGFAFIGIIIGAASTFLFAANTKNNGTVIART